MPFLKAFINGRLDGQIVGLARHACLPVVVLITICTIVLSQQGHSESNWCHDVGAIVVSHHHLYSTGVGGWGRCVCTCVLDGPSSHTYQAPPPIQSLGFCPPLPKITTMKLVPAKNVLGEKGEPKIKCFLTARL